MFLRWPAEWSHEFIVWRGVPQAPVPQAMFSPIWCARFETGSGACVVWSGRASSARRSHIQPRLVKGRSGVGGVSPRGLSTARGR